MRFNINANISLGMTAVEALNPYLVFVYTKRMLLFLPVGNIVLLPLEELVLPRSRDIVRYSPGVGGNWMSTSFRLITCQYRMAGKGGTVRVTDCDNKA